MMPSIIHLNYKYLKLISRRSMILIFGQVATALEGISLQREVIKELTSNGETGVSSSQNET